MDRDGQPLNVGDRVELVEPYERPSLHHGIHQVYGKKFTGVMYTHERGVILEMREILKKVKGKKYILVELDAPTSVNGNSMGRRPDSATVWFGDGELIRDTKIDILEKVD